MLQWLHALDWPVKFTWPHNCEAPSSWVNMNIRYRCLMWEYCTFGRQEFDQLKYVSVSLLPQITIRRYMNLSKLRMWSNVNKQIWLGYPIHCSLQMYAFDSEWDHSPTLLQSIALSVAGNADLGMHSTHFCPLSHQMHCGYMNWFWVKSFYLVAIDMSL